MSWVRAARADEVVEGEGHTASLAGRKIAIFNVEGSFYACDGICTHAHAFLAEGYVEGEEVECPMHSGRFNVRTGKALCAPAQVDLKVYPVEVRDGVIHVELPPEGC